MAQVLTVVSGKGGTGKTSVCAAVASCLAMEGRRVLCIDLDVGLRNLDLALGMQEQAVLPFTAVMRGEYALEQAAAHPTIERLFLLTAPVTETPESIGEAQFSALLAQAREAYDWILLDAPAGVGRLFTLSVHAADEAAVVALADAGSQRDAARAAELIFAERELPVRLIVNRVSPKLLAGTHLTVDDLMDRVGLPLLGLVPEDAEVTLASCLGVPLVERTYRGAALACLHIARRLCGQRVPLMKL